LSLRRLIDIEFFSSYRVLHVGCTNYSSTKNVGFPSGNIYIYKGKLEDENALSEGML
jgi:hypothetical protein